MDGCIQCYRHVTGSDQDPNIEYLDHQESISQLSWTQILNIEKLETLLYYSQKIRHQPRIKYNYT